jgi:DNA topoisomerase-1
VQVVDKTSVKQSGERILGIDPKTNRQVLVRIGRFGPMVQIGKQDDEEKQLYASLRKGQSIETITLQEALDLFKLPRTLGELEGKEVIISIGRFGPYIRLGNDFISLPKTEDPYTVSFERVKEILSGPRLPRTIGDYEGKPVVVAKGFFGNYIKYDTINASLNKKYDPFTITLEQAIPILQEKIKKDAEKLIKAFDQDSRVKIVHGKYGPCIQAGRKFFKIPKEIEPIDLTLEQCLELAGFKNKKKAKPEKTKDKAETKTAKPKAVASKKRTIAKAKPAPKRAKVTKKKK